MAKDAVATMGSILPDDAGGRDAVHVAVASAVCDVRLRPGQDVGIEIVEGRDVKARPASPTTEGVGKVDPYLTALVEPGQRFWLYLYPRSITGLNHNWSHPAFPDAKAGEAYANPSAKLTSEAWLKNYANEVDEGYHTVLDAAADWLRSEEYYVQHDKETARDYGVPDEFWDHYENVTGEKVPADKKQSFWSCSC